LGMFANCANVTTPGKSPAPQKVPAKVNLGAFPLLGSDAGVEFVSEFNLFSTLALSMRSRWDRTAVILRPAVWASESLFCFTPIGGP
jgi:hypothetical protein